MTPYYYEENGITIYNGDCLEIMKQFEDKSFDLVLTDPPYGIGYKGENRPNETKRDVIENDNREINYKSLIIELERLGKDVIIWGANNFSRDLPHNGRWICWDKRLSEKADRMLGSPFELAWSNRETGYYKMYRILHGGAVNADGYGIKRVHPTQKPIELMRRIIEDYKSNFILDPFMGSGTTLIAAKQLGRKAVGIEIVEKYCKIAKQRLEATPVLLF